MSEFLKLVYEVVWGIILNIYSFFESFALSIYKLFYTDIADLIVVFQSYTIEFGAFQWILTVLFILILLAIPALIIWRIIVAIRKSVGRRRDNISQDDLLKEIGLLNRQVVELVDEKNKLLALKVAQLGLTPGDAESLVAQYSRKDANEQQQAADSNRPVRFPKLAAVDAKYKNFVYPEYNDTITLPEIVSQYRNFACSRMHLYYSESVVRYFIAGLATSKLIILEGISGTGKTSLPYSFSRFLQNPSTLISVQPSYRDRTELLGYFNEFTKRFNETEFLRALYEAGKRPDPSLIVLDEMNLARIEYYFAEMLSVLEMPTVDEWIVDLVPTGWPSDPIDMHDGKLNVSTSTWFVGTANNDDSTFTITDKVYDRAMPIELNNRGEAFDAPDTPPISVSSGYLESLFEKAKEDYSIDPKTIQKINTLDSYLQTRFKLSFGNRILKQIDDFIPVFMACGGTEGEALDYLISRKIFKKFESLNISYVRDEIKELIAFIEKTFGKTALPDSKKYLTRIQNMF